MTYKQLSLFSPSLLFNHQSSFIFITHLASVTSNEIHKKSDLFAITPPSSSHVHLINGNWTRTQPWPHTSSRSISSYNDWLWITRP